MLNGKGIWTDTGVLGGNTVIEGVTQDCTICRISSLLLLCSFQFYGGYFNGS